MYKWENKSQTHFWKKYLGSILFVEDQSFGLQDHFHEVILLWLQT